MDMKSRDLKVDHDEVRVVGGRLAGLEGVRTIPMGSILEVLQKSPRCFGPFVQQTNMNDLPEKDELDRGCAYMILWDQSDWFHLVLLYRGYDGDYFYFDSDDSLTPRPLFRYFRRHNIKCYRLPVPLQLPGTGTCGYHVFAFLDWLFKNRYVPTKEIRYQYPYDNRKFWDLVALETFEDILSEFPNNIKLRQKLISDKILVQSRVPADCIAARIKRRSQKRQRETLTEGTKAKRIKM